MTAPRLLAFDLESSPMLSYHWSRWNQNIHPNQTVEESRVLCFGAMWLDTGKYTFKAAYEHGREEMLTTIQDLLTQADGVVSWNGQRFDTNKINTEFFREGMTPPAPYVEVDLMRAVKRRFAFSSNKLDSVAKEMNVGEKIIHQGMPLWLDVMAGDKAAQKLFAKYQKQDVVLLRDLYKILLPWLPTHPNAGLFADEEEIVCPNCGSTNLQKRGYSYTSASKFQRYQCECGKWSHGTRRLATTELRS